MIFSRAYFFKVTYRDVSQASGRHMSLQALRLSVSFQSSQGGRQINVPIWKYWSLGSSLKTSCEVSPEKKQSVVLMFCNFPIYLKCDLSFSEQFFYWNDVLLHKKSWFQISVKSVKLSGYMKRMCIIAIGDTLLYRLNYS